MNPLQDLTPAQHAAVVHGEGPLLVLAGAGSGKTRVITCRVAHLIDQGIDSRSILAITFTNKAAQEMQERIARLTGGAKVWVSTFHAFCARVLRRYAGRVGYGAGFTILDDADQRVAIREALLETGTDPKVYSPIKVLYAIERAKDQLKSPSDLEADAVSDFDAAAARAYGYYQELLQSSNAMDFSDLLVQAVRLLQQDDVRRLFAERYRYLLIDEYQDTNHSQYQLARLLAQEHRNVCATGDPDQSIYGWRGADITNILRFEEDYPEAQVVTLAENFRSTRLILDAANGLIRHNAERREKDLVTTGPDGAPLAFHVAADEHEEARWVARRVRERLQEGVPPEEIAVFYRVGALSRAVETGLLERRVPFRVVGSVGFYQRREVKDVLSFLRLIHNPDDDVAAQRVLNVPARGIGKGTIGKLREHAKEEGGSLVSAAAALAEGSAVRGKGRAGLGQFVALLERLRERAAAEPAVERVVRAVLEETSYADYVKQISATPSEEQDRALNLEALVAGAHDFDRRFGVPAPAPLPDPLAARREEPEPEEPDEGEDAPSLADLPLFAVAAPAAPAPTAEEVPAPPGVDDAEAGGVQGFLQQVALLSAAEEDQTDEGKVSLMTVHAAKGLEFDTVFVIGLEEGLFPHSRALEDPSGIEEERRLAYVAITRAKKQLTLTRANWRSLHGQSRPQRQSLFLLEVPPEVFEAGCAPAEVERGYARYADSDADAWGADPTPWDDVGVDEPPAGDVGRRPRRRRTWQQPLRRPSPGEAPPPARPPAQTPGDLVASALAAADAPAGSSLRKGDRVHHEHFGYGVVLEIAGAAHKRRAKVRFDQHRFGVKDLVLQYARITKVEPGA